MERRMDADLSDLVAGMGTVRRDLYRPYQPGPHDSRILRRRDSGADDILVVLVCGPRGSRLAHRNVWGGRDRRIGDPGRHACVFLGPEFLPDGTFFRLRRSL